MTIDVYTPTYIAKANIDSTDIRFKWDDWDVHKADRPADPIIVKRMDSLWFRAITAYTIACGEWVLHRFKDLYNDFLPFDYFEALWARNINPYYSVMFRPIDDEWKGPIKRPIELAILIANDAFLNVYDNVSPSENASWMTNLALHVLPTTDKFIEWHNAVLDRLEHFYKADEQSEDDFFDEEDRLGPYVPREVFDPQFSFSINLADSLTQKFLNQLDPDQNPFVYDAEQMIELGCEDTPYKVSSKDKED